MNTLELKNILKFKIDSINDKDFLNALYTFLESKNDFIVLTEEQKKSIKNGQKEYESGNYFENDKVNEEIEKWFREK